MPNFFDARAIPLGTTEVCESLTVFRFDAPAPPTRYRSEALSACLVWQGVGRAEVDGRHYVCAGGNYIVKALAPNGFETEILEASGDAPFLATLVQFQDQEVAGAVDEMRQTLPADDIPAHLQAPWVHVDTISTDLRQLVSSLGRLGSSPSCLENTLLYGLRRRELLYTLLLPLFEGEIVAGDLATAHAPDLQAAIALLSQDLAIPLRVADLARAVNMSPSRFAHVFKEATGVSPHRFRKQLRLERAKFLLDEENWSVTAVATEVGYSNVSHFISEFKRIFGATPGSIAGKPGEPAR